MKTLLILLCLSTLAISQKLPLDSLIGRIDKSVKTFNPAGVAVAVVHDGKIIFKKAYGYSDTEKETPLTTQSIFNIASCTTAFTSTMMAMMVEQGKLSWQDKVVDYFPDFKLADPYISQNLNMVDLFCHRSGFSTFTGDLLWYHTNYSNAEIRKRMQYLPLSYGFREKYGYQNNMFMIGGEIIAKQTGKTWEENLQTLVLDKLEMHGTRISNDVLQEGDPVAWPHNDRERIYLYDFEGNKPAASMFSSVEDLSNWVIFNLNEGIWKSDTLIAKSSINFLTQMHKARPVSNWNKNNGRNFTLIQSLPNGFGVRLNAFNS